MNWKSVFRWFGYAIFSISLEVFSYLFAPVLALFSRMEYGPTNNNNDFGIEPRLPKWLSWFQTPDNSLWGDFGWQIAHCPGYWGTFVGMIRWLWRNPCYGVAWTVLAAKLDPNAEVKCWGDPTINDENKTSFRPGWCFVTVGQYWHLSIVCPLRSWKYLDWNFGWKVKRYALNPEALKTAPPAPLVHSPRFANFPEGYEK